MRTQKCRKKGCEFRYGPASKEMPKYCPEHNDLNKSAVSLGKLGGSKTSEKKKEATRKNLIKARAAKNPPVTK